MSNEDAIAVPTPEAVALEFPVATAGSRFVALLLDSVFMGAGAAVLMILMAGLRAAIAGRAEMVWLRAGEIAVLFLVFWGYFSFFEIVWRGQTPGKRLVHLRVLAANGRPATVRPVLVRNLVRLVDALPGVYAVGAFCMLLNRRAQRLGDLAAGTIVVHEVAPELPAALAAAPAGAMAAVRGLSAEDLELIEIFLQRRRGLTDEVRAAMRARIGQRLRPRLPAEAEPWTESEAGLEALAAAARTGRR